jgi:hypothetical protein
MRARTEFIWFRIEICCEHGKEHWGHMETLWTGYEMLASLKELDSEDLVN